MKTNPLLILQMRQAKRFAGQTVAEMIRLGCSVHTMKHMGLPRTVFYWLLGERTWESTNPTAAAQYLMRELPKHILC
jgi:hypothetical protein